MNICKFVRNIAFDISEEVGKTDEYKTLNKEIITLQEELRKELSESELQILMKIDELESKSDAFIIDFACKQAFLHGITIGQAMEANKGGTEI
ncbi:hypothetical protein [Clostridium sp. BNL1100]|uniref:DUF6809 family protein n=1 Tax=Clostridium sp. BNL1100 TaxID=755731 RepID=UPI00024A72A0|nr:hypothetical protein [Clostridium sp. BNL1100]AEY66345.1 hypothetical protein Clo1100_2161 [Clostridium sp. BNL1100]